MAGLRRLDPPKARVLKRPAKALAPHPAPPLTDEQQVALDAIATDLGLTRERVRQIQIEGLERLRKIIKRGNISRDSLL